MHRLLQHTSIFKIITLAWLQFVAGSLDGDDGRVASYVHIGLRRQIRIMQYNNSSEPIAETLK